jgi:exonuclease III
MISKKPILVLSYNICFQAMCNDSSGSAYELGKSCTWIVEDKLTICAQNMADFIDGAPTTLKYSNFDFVGLQEANKARYLQTAASQSLAKLEMKHSKTNATNGGHAMQMASFYNPTKYKLIEYLPSQFNSRTTDRPFHILILEDISTNEKIIFINVHAPHGGSENTKHPGHYYSSFDTVSYDLSAAAQSMSQFDASINYKIIMTGDFNETGWDWQTGNLRTMKWQPLAHAGIKINAEISNVVFSCNQPNGCWTSENGQRGGDYVFSSGTAANIVVPSNYVFAPKGSCGDISQMKSIWQSDHLPVMSELS